MEINVQTLHHTFQPLLGLFYIHNISDTYRQPLQSVPKYVENTYPYFAVMIALEWSVLVIKKGMKAVSVADGVCSVMQGLHGQMVVTVAQTLQTAVYVFVWRNWRVFDVPHNTAVGFCATMLAVDLIYYCFHRAAHECNILWASHQVHHSSEYYNLTTALRQSVLQPYFSWAFYIPLAVAGVAPSMFLTHAQFNTIYQFWIHTELVDRLGPLELVLNTPSHHRVHHATNRHYLDKNYAGVLIVWDRLFGTFCAEKQTPIYGLVHKIETYSAWTIQFSHFQWTAQEVHRLKGLTNKLKRIFYGPGWSEEGSGARLGDLHAVPEPDPNRPLFARSYTRTIAAMPVYWLEIYVLAHFCAILLTVMPHTSMEQGIDGQLWSSNSAGLVSGIAVTVSLTCLGWLLDTVWWAPTIETIRCLSALYLVGLVDTAELSPRFCLLLCCTSVLFTLSLVIWTMYHWNYFTSQKKMMQRIKQ